MSQVSSAVNAVQQKLQVCQQGKLAIDGAKQTYDSAKILLDAAAHAMDTAQQELEQIAAIVEQRLKEKIDAAVSLEKSVEDMIRTIANPGAIVRGRDPLDACIAVQDVISRAAQTANSVQGQVDSITNLHNESLTQLAQATEVYEDKKRAYENAKAGVAQAQTAVINIGKILGRK
jgi:hypothetical protein